MSADFNLETLGLLLLFVFPGLVSTQVYRLIMPARPTAWGDSLLQSLFYTAINFTLLFPLVPFVVNTSNQEQHPALYWLAIVALILFGPIAWAFILRALFKSKAIASRIQIPFPTPWDYFFDLRQPTFLLITLTNGSRVGGFWGPDSYAGSFPNDGDIYLEAVYDLDENGRFGEAKKDTLGLLIRRDQYTCVELFAVPPQPIEELNEQE
jgi:hypothetical protein